jgi:hypothetical protein
MARVRPRRSLTLRGVAVAALATAARASCAAPAGDPLAGLSGARAKEIATELASDAMEGRKTGFPSGRRAEERVAALFREAGLRPAGDDGGWFHEFRFGTSDVAPPIGLSVGGVEIPYGAEGFVDLIHTGDGVARAEVVFVGYGISAPDRGWDDYADVDVTGKVVLALRGLPRAREGDFGEERAIGWKSSLAARRGAAGFLIAEGAGAVKGTIQERYHAAALPAAWVAETVADRILAPRGRTLAGLRRSRDDGDPGRSFGTGVAVRLEVHGRVLAEAVGRNVLGKVEGSDPALAREVVLLGAHLDHLGVDARGRVFNGADDNASGTAAVAHVAETLVRNGWAPRRTVVFCGFAAEEQGLEGSVALAKRGLVDGRVPVAMVNLDMAGLGTTRVALAGLESYPRLRERLRAGVGEEAWAGFGRGRAEPNSDHWPFLARGVPSVFAVTEGERPSYHRPEDDPEHLKPECLEAAARAVGRFVATLCDEPAPLLGREGLESRLLRESARLSWGPRATEALARWAAPGGEDPREEAQTLGACGVVVDVSEDGDGPVVAIARLRALVDEPKEAEGPRDGKDARGARGRWILVSSATDLGNALRGGRVAVLPRLVCPRSVAAFPGVLASFRALGYRLAAPFSASSPPEDAHLDAVADAAAAAGVVVDATGLSEAALARMRARARDVRLLVRADALPAGPDGDDALRRLRLAVGRPGVVVVPPTPAGLLRAAVDGPEAAGDPRAAVLVASDDGDALAEMLKDVVAERPALREPDHPGREALRSLLGDAWVSLLRARPSD